MSESSKVKLEADKLVEKQLLNPVPEVSVAPKVYLAGSGIVIERLIIVPQRTHCWLTADWECRWWLELTMQKERYRHSETVAVFVRGAFKQP